MNKPYQCLECGRRHTLASANRIVNGNGRCACGGVDIDLAVPAKPERRRCAVCGGFSDHGNHTRCQTSTW